MSDARVLAELMGWILEIRVISPPGQIPADAVEGWWPPGGKCTAKLPAYDTDLNAMREVWKVLKERGRWEDFYIAWAKMGDGDTSIDGFLQFLNDLPGQIKAAIKVLKEVQ